MRHSLHALLASGFLLAGTAIAPAQQSNHIAILPDTSGSFRGAHDAPFAARVAQDVAQRLPGIGMRDVITFTPLGEYGRNLTREAQVTKRFPPAVAKRTITSMVAGFPDALHGEMGGTQKATNILGALDKTARRMDCAERTGHVFVLSDGQETGQALTLPKSAIFNGCASFTIIGVEGQDPAQTQALGAFWMRWCQAAGFQRCDWLS